MTNKTLVNSSYEAAFLSLRNHDFHLVPKEHGRQKDCHFLFRSSRRLETDRQAYLDDVDIHEYTQCHRLIKQQVRDTLKRIKRDETQTEQTSKADHEG